MFGEVMSIDMALNDLRSAKSLFYLGRKNGIQDSALMLELNRILQTGDLKWARDVVGDPTEKLDEIKGVRAMSRSALSGRKDLADGVDEMYAREIANLLKAVAKVDGLPAARKIQSKALKFLDSPAVRKALKGG